MALISLLLLLFASIWLDGTTDAAAFTPAPCWSSGSKSKSSSRRYLFWFTAKKDEPRNNNSNNNNNSNKNDSNSNIASVTQVMDSMDDLKRVQDVGKLTATLLEELDRLVIEGSAANGKVKVTRMVGNFPQMYGDVVPDIAENAPDKLRLRVARFAQ